MKVIGLISSISVNGTDAALVEISGSTHDLKVDLIAGETYPYPAELRSQILAVCGGAVLSRANFAVLDDAIAITLDNFDTILLIPLINFLSIYHRISPS